jgi:hypothetical protein
MMTTATHNTHDNTPEAVLFMAFELSENTWKLGFTIGHGQKPRERTWVFRTMTFTCLHTDFPLLSYESACNSSASRSTKRQ